MNMQTTAKSIPPLILARAAALQTTSEYIIALATVVENQIDTLRDHMRSPDMSGRFFAEVGDWREMMTIISLMKSQAEIVGDVSADLDSAMVAQ